MLHYYLPITCQSSTANHNFFASFQQWINQTELPQAWRYASVSRRIWERCWLSDKTLKKTKDLKNVSTELSVTLPKGVTFCISQQHHVPSTSICLSLGNSLWEEVEGNGFVYTRKENTGHDEGHDLLYRILCRIFFRKIKVINFSPCILCIEQNEPSLFAAKIGTIES